MRVAFVQWPDGLIPDTDAWSTIAADVTKSAPEVLITNEMPFGPWLASSPTFDVERAKESVRIHEDGLRALQALEIPIVISSRPVRADGVWLTRPLSWITAASTSFIRNISFPLRTAGSKLSGSGRLTLVLT